MNYVRSHARFDPDGIYRYELHRVWEEGAAGQPRHGRVVWIMLNPSTADASQDDPTIRRCVAFARQWGYSGITVVNLFAFRATIPRDLLRPRRIAGVDLVGPENDATICRWIEDRETAIVVAAWGAHAASVSSRIGRDRAREVAVLVESSPIASRHGMWCLGTTAKGYPRHPLYVRRDAQRIKWDDDYA